MSLHDELKKAVAAHSLWKTRLAAAIDTGKSEYTSESIRTDNQCEFGKWLYGPTITATEKAGKHYEGVRKLHAEFHKLAGDVLKLALAGKKDEAHKMIESGPFANLSADLTRAMMKWRAETPE
jgi:hypothetical protein